MSVSYRSAGLHKPLPRDAMDRGIIQEETGMDLRSRFGSRFADLTIERLTVGSFCTGVKLSNGAGGLCFTPVPEIPPAVCSPSSLRTTPRARDFQGRPVVELLGAVFDPSPSKRAIGIAIMSALSATYWERYPSFEKSIERGFDALDSIVIPEDAHVVVIGVLVPILARLKDRGRPFTIVESDRRRLKSDEVPFWVPVERTAEVVPKADLLVITGRCLSFSSLESILGYVKPDTVVLVVGPTASMLPEDDSADLRGRMDPFTPDPEARNPNDSAAQSGHLAYFGRFHVSIDILSPTLFTLQILP